MSLNDELITTKHTKLKEEGKMEGDTHVARKATSYQRTNDSQLVNENRDKTTHVTRIIEKQDSAIEEDLEEISLDENRASINQITVLENIEFQENDIVGNSLHGQELLDECPKTTCTVLAWNILFLLIIIIASVLWSTPITMIPTTNIIIYPEYWWEMIVNGDFLTYAIMQAGFTMVECKLIFGLVWIDMRWLFFCFFIIFYVLLTSIWCISYLIWTVWLEYNSPIPFAALIIYLLNNLVAFITMWLVFPREMKMMKEADKKRINMYILFRLWFVGYALQQSISNAVMGMMDKDFQWTMSIFFPILRESNVWVMDRILSKAIDLDTTVPVVSKITTSLSMNATFAFFVAQTISASEFQLVGYGLVAVDLLLNFFSIYKIVNMSRRVTPTENENDEKKRKLEVQEEVFKLIGTELIEILVPIIFIISFILAYEGKNANVIGGVKGSFWHYKAVDDIANFSFNLMVMFMIDIFCCIVSACLLWKFSSINVLVEVYKLMEMFWKYMTILIGGMITMVSCLLSANKIKVATKR